MIEKARTHLDKELRACFRNKKHALNRNAPESEIQSISEKISVLQFLLRTLDAIEMIRKDEN